VPDAVGILNPLEEVNMKMPSPKLVLLGSFLILLSLCPAVIAQDGAGAGTEVLTNAKVITMVKASLPPSLIVNKIRASKSNFNTNTDELISLQQARVPTEVINAMVEASSHASAVTSSIGAGDVSKADPNDPAAAHEAGIYLLLESDGKKTMTQLEPSTSKQTKSGGFLASDEFNRAFVLMQFFGYLRRNPNDPQDTDYSGYDFWLTKLNQFDGNFQNAEMVKAFITSGEYRQRFGP
jgi:hypothetical protein